jgi:hypothetical protein
MEQRAFLTIKPETLLENVELLRDNESRTPLRLTGRYARGGKYLQFAVDVSVDETSLGKNPRKLPRIKLEEVFHFDKQQALDITLVSTLRDDDLVPFLWGPRRELPDLSDMTFGPYSWVRAKVIAIDESGIETDAIAFELTPTSTPESWEKLVRILRKHDFPVRQMDLRAFWVTKL